MYEKIKESKHSWSFNLLLSDVNFYAVLLFEFLRESTCHHKLFSIVLTFLLTGNLRNGWLLEL